MAHKQETPSSVDLEETAELPMLPGVSNAIADDPLSATDAYHGQTVFLPPPDGAGVREYMADVARREDTREQRIALGQHEAEIGALRSDLASVTESRGQLEHNLGNLTNNLRELEQMLNRKSEQLSMFEREVGNRDRRITELESRSATVDGELAAVSSERETLRSDLKAAREEAEAAQKLIRERDVSSGTLLREREQQARRVRMLESDLNQARIAAERYRETLQSMEGRRQIFESMLDERESELIARGGTVVKLEAEINKRTQLNVARETDMKSMLTAEQARVRQLEQQAIIHRAEEESLRRSVGDAHAAADEKLAKLRNDMEAQQKSISELRSQLDSVNASLEERNALIARLETEMVSSSQVLGSIQHNLEHLGDAEPTRMLVRTQGDTGIVQLLGRRTTVGRTPDNDIHLNEDFISRHHAVLLLAGASTVLEDLNSTNGSYVNGERMSRRTLKEGDLVTLGKTEFRFVIKKAAERSA
jgi:chromosome segregation ATPase